MLQDAPPPPRGHTYAPRVQQNTLGQQQHTAAAGTGGAGEAAGLGEGGDGVGPMSTGGAARSAGC
eukprot:9505602-Alexandrium_andersonii.AAC.1